MTLKDKILKPFQNNPTYEAIRTTYWKIKEYPTYKKVQSGIQERKNGNFDEKYSDFLKLKNKYKGNRCFIIATGPSLTLDDLDKLKGEYTFAMNSIKKLYDKTDWRPTFFGIQDKYVYNAMQDVIINTNGEEQINFISDKLKEIYNVPDNYVTFPYDEWYHLYEGKLNVPNAKFTDDAQIIIYDGYSITYSLIQIAVYMGFTEIYLLGCDCSWGKGKDHIIESGHVDKYAMLNPVKQRTAYPCALEYSKNHNFKIYNATRGGELETFERVNLDDVLKG